MEHDDYKRLSGRPAARRVIPVSSFDEDDLPHAELAPLWWLKVLAVALLLWGGVMGFVWLLTALVNR